MMRQNIYKFLSILVFAGTFLGLFLNPNHYDFIEYWSAYRAFLGDLPIYSPDVILEIQRNVDGRQLPMMMWNPPWTLFIFAPILWLDINTAYILWQILAVASVALAIALIDKQAGQLGWKLMAALSFPPVFYCIKLGQLSTFFCLGAALFYTGQKEKSHLKTCIGIIFLTLKPHLFWLIAAWFALGIIVNRNVKSFLAITATLSALVILCILIGGSTIPDWINAVVFPNPAKNYVNTNEWICPTLPPVLSLFLTGSTYLGKLIFTLIASTSIYLAYKFHLYRKETINNSNVESFYLVSLVSLWTSPFGWFFDMSAVAIGYLQFLKNLSRRYDFYLLTLVFLSVNYLFNIFIVPRFHYHHQMWWGFPMVGTLLYFSWKHRDSEKL